MWSRSVAAGLVLAAMCLGCGSGPRVLQHHPVTVASPAAHSIVGDWVVDLPSGKGSMLFRPDGTFLFTSPYTGGGSQLTGNIRGTYAVGKEWVVVHILLETV